MMKDRFKFRAWYCDKDDENDSDNNKMFYNAQDTYDCLGGNPPLGASSFGDIIDDECWVVEQCTGLKDKNGKLIYEGDWLKTKGGYYCYVVWFDGFWWVKSLPSEAMDLEHAEFYKECEVVGNIHENADLLEVKDD